MEAVEILFEVESRKRHTTAQSSTLEVGYLHLQALTADSTRALAADERAGTEATMSTTSLFESTSQIYNNGEEQRGGKNFRQFDPENKEPNKTFKEAIGSHTPSVAKTTNSSFPVRHRQVISGTEIKPKSLRQKSPKARAIASPGESLFGSQTRATSGSSRSEKTRPLHFRILSASPARLNNEIRGPN